MADLRIVDAPEIPTENITGEEKLPTGGNGNYSISLDSLADYTKTKKNLADNTSVDTKVNGVRQELETHIEDLLNPHQVTKGQIGLGNVDNTADLDKPVSNSTQSAIISAVAPKADKNYVDNQLALKANKTDVYTKSETYTKQESTDLVNNSISIALTPVNSSLDLVKRGIANRYDSSLTYKSGERVVLTNGDIVKSTINGNTSNPNTDMAGWVKTNSTSQIFDESGLNQQEVNNGVTTIADLLAITNPKNGNRVYVKGYRAATNLALAKPYKGGGDFVFISENAGVNNGITIFNGWTRLGITDNVTPEMAGAYANDINSDADAFDIAIQYAHANSLQVHAMGATYFIDREVNILLGTSYGTQGTILKGAGKAKTFIRFAENVDCFNLTNTTQPLFATNCEITDLSFTQTGSAINTGVALKTASNITNLNLHNISFFGCKQAIKFPEQFYIARLTSLHAQGCTYGFELGREGTTLFLDNLFVTGGGGQSDSFAYKIRASYTTIGSLACDDFHGQSYDFQYGQYDIGALGLELLHSKGAFGNISFYQSKFHIENIEIVNANNLTSTDLIISSGDSSGSIGNIDTNNTAAISPAQLFRSMNSNVDIGGVSGTTTYAKSTYADQANIYGIELYGVRYQRGDMRPFLGLGNSNLPDQLTSHTNPCKQSILFDSYGAGFNYSGYSGTQDWRFFPAPNLGDWAIQRRPDLFGIAATVSLADGGINNDRTQAQEGVVPLVVFVKPSSPATGCIYINTVAGKVEMYSGSAWLPLN